MASVRHPGAATQSSERPRPAGHHQRRVSSGRVLLAVWLVGTLVNGGLLVAWPALEHPSPVVGSVAVVLQVAATAALLWWLGPVPIGTLAAAPETRRGALSLATGLAVLALFPLGAAGLVVLVPIGVAAAVILAVLRDVGSPRELVTAIAVAALATVGGLVEATTGAIAGGWAWAQLPLVAVALLAGWRIAHRLGWADSGIGPPRRWCTAPATGCATLPSGLPWRRHGRWATSRTAPSPKTPSALVGR